MLRKSLTALAALTLTGAAALAQTPPPMPPPTTPPAAPVAPAAPAVAATVNNEPVSEAAVQRALRTVRAEKHAEARGEILNVLIDKYLRQMQINIESKEVDQKIEEIKKNRPDWDSWLKKMDLTEPELKQ